MRPDRIFTTVVVAALVATAAFTGAVSAAEPAGAPVANQQDADAQSVTISDTIITNLSTELEVSGADVTVEGADGTQELTVDSASVTLDGATVEITEATLQGDSVELNDTSVTITEGEVSIESSQGSMTMDLSGTNESVDSVTVSVDDVASDLGLMDNLRDSTIDEMTVEDVSGSSSVDVLAVNMQVQGARETNNLSVSVGNGDIAFEGATVQMENVRVVDDTLLVGSVNTSVDSAQVTAERVVVLEGLSLTEYENVDQSFENAQFSQEDVEIELDDLTSLLGELVGAQAASSVES